VGNALNVLVTSAGAMPAAAVIKALRLQKRYALLIGAADMAEHAVGFCMADWSVRIPPAPDPAFVPTLLRICAERDVKYVFPVIDEELIVWSRARGTFAEAGITVFANPPACIERACDKRRTAEFCSEAAIAHPRCYSKEEVLDLPTSRYPFFTKPANGRGSIGASRVDSAEELRQHVARFPGCLVQEYIQGDEYTTDILLREDGELVAAVPKLRLEIKSGMATKSITRAEPRILAFVCDVAARFGVRGAANVQTILRGEEPVLLEVNPKFATSLPLTVAAGVNIPLHLIELERGEFESPTPMPFQEGLLLLRCWDDFFERVAWKC
jgi:carbamoyl-phosphate synthase large subunit